MFVKWRLNTHKDVILVARDIGVSALPVLEAQPTDAQSIQGFRDSGEGFLLLFITKGCH
jgi:hypothetical protein